MSRAYWKKTKNNFWTPSVPGLGTGDTVDNRPGPTSKELMPSVF